MGGRGWQDRRRIRDDELRLRGQLRVRLLPE